MSLYTTPTPPGLPDYSVAQQQPGQLLTNTTSTYTTPRVLGGFYVGNVNSITFYITFSASALSLVTCKVWWGQSSTFASAVWQLDTYTLQCQTSVYITDTLPCVGPYVFFQLAGPGTTVSFQAIVLSTLSSTRGASSVGGGGVCIQGIESVAHGTTTIAYGAYVTPGLYTWCLAPQGTVTSTTATLCSNNGSPPNFGVLAQVFNPVQSTPYSGTVVVGEYQPIWYLNNGNASTTWTVDCYLIGPQV